MSKTTVTMNREQKRALVHLRSRLESETGETVSLAEAVEVGAGLAQDRLNDNDVSEVLE